MKIVLAIPVYNEEAILAKNIKTLWDFCFKNFIDSEVVIIIADNNSTDRTAQIADDLAAANPAIQHLFIPQKGKGLAIASAWRALEADVYGFMDADLSTDLSALPLALREIRKGLSGRVGADVVIGSRLKLSKGNMPWYRTVGIWGLNLITLIIGPESNSSEST